MADHIGILQGEMNLFVIMNGFFCLSVSLWLSRLFSTKRYLFIKPSILLILYTHIFLQWPVTLYSGYYESFLPDPFVFVLMIHGFTVIGLLVSSYTLHGPSREAWQRMAGASAKIDVRPSVVIALSTIIFVITIMYLHRVPFTQTGFYAILHALPDTDLIRERSMKLLDDIWLKYAYSVMRTTLVPLLAAILTISFERSMKNHRYASVIYILFAMAGLAFVISLPGEKSAVVNLLIVIVATFLFQRGIPINSKNIAFLIILILLPAFVVGLLQAGGNFSLPNILEWLRLILNRSFVVPLDVCSWYAHYIQTHSVFGIAGIPKLAALAGVQPIDIHNLIGLEYIKPVRLTSISAGAGYLITYYSLFGALSIVLSLMGLWLIDLAVLVYRHLDKAMLIACAASLALSTLNFIQTSYTTVWLTHGFGLIPLISLLASTKFSLSFRPECDAASCILDTPTERSVRPQ